MRPIFVAISALAAGTLHGLRVLVKSLALGVFHEHVPMGRVDAGLRRGLSVATTRLRRTWIVCSDAAATTKIVCSDAAATTWIFRGIPQLRRELSVRRPSCVSSVLDQSSLFGAWITFESPHTDDPRCDEQSTS